MAPTLDPDTIKPPKSAENSQNNSQNSKKKSPEKETPPEQKKEKEKKEKPSREPENSQKGKEKSLLKRLEAASSDLADLCSSPLSSINQNTISSTVPKKKETKTKFRLPSIEDVPDSFENVKSSSGKDQKGEWKKTNKSKLVDEKIPTIEKIVPIKTKEISPKKSKKDLSKSTAAPVETYEKEAVGTKVSKKRKRESDSDTKQSPKKKKKVSKKPKRIEISSEPEDESMTSSEEEMEEEPPVPKKKTALKKKETKPKCPKSPVAVFKVLIPPTQSPLCIFSGLLASASPRVSSTSY